MYPTLAISAKASTMKRRIPSWTTNAAAEIGANVSAWRRMLGLTQAELADRAGVSRETLSRLENGDGAVSLNTVLNILHIFGVLNPFVDASNPYATPFGMARATQQLPQRVVRKRPRTKP